jgi:hypothetical protein
VMSCAVGIEARGEYETARFRSRRPFEHVPEPVGNMENREIGLSLGDVTAPDDAGLRYLNVITF